MSQDPLVARWRQLAKEVKESGPWLDRFCFLRERINAPKGAFRKEHRRQDQSRQYHQHYLAAFRHQKQVCLQG